MALAGMGAGIVAALAMNRLTASLLYGVRPAFFLAFVIDSVILTIVALLASCIPALRAIRVDPTIAPRHEGQRESLRLRKKAKPRTEEIV
jgi:putative ABC transport system permease protein